MKKELNPCFISSYVPKQCGIATFTKNLFTSYQSIFNCNGKIVAIDDDLQRDFPPEVHFVFDRNKTSDYAKAAEKINASDVQVISLQHEFGLFGGPEGRFIAKLLEKLNKPVVSTIHTVLQDPNLGYYTSLMEIINNSDRLVVMSNKAIEILQEVYYVPPEKVVMIPHGIPDRPFVDPDPLKEARGTKGRFVLLTFGLLSPGKGLEMVLEALPEVTKAHPEVLYVILGKTHPEVVKLRGETYRESLQKMVREYSLENNVLFIDEFLSDEELFDYICSSDVYITPYLSPEQITSGTLAYAVGLGKAIVSTPYWYARELLADGRGSLVPFSNPKALANTLNELLTQKGNLQEMRLASYNFGREMIWARVSEKYNELFKEVYKEHAQRTVKKVSAIRKNAIDNFSQYKPLDMLERMTDDAAIFQFTVKGIPDLKNGYSADDVGRALEVLMKQPREENPVGYSDSQEFRLARKYLSFLNYVQKEDGRFHNFVSYDRRFLDDVGSDDTFGRVLVGLGSTIAWSPDQSLAFHAREIFDRAIAGLQPNKPCSTYIRSLSYAICGFYGYLDKHPEARQVADLLRSAADYLVELYQSEVNCDADWHWFEPVLTYGNAKVPYALMLAYTVFKDKNYLDIALKSLDFLTDIQYNGTYFDVIGNQGWLQKGKEKAPFDQQPIEIGYLVEAYGEAYRRTRKKEYRTLAKKAFHWFFGNNRLEVPVYNTSHSYPLDGLNMAGVNNNSGAEAVISFALAVTALKKIKFRKTMKEKLQALKAKSKNSN